MNKTTKTQIPIESLGSPGIVGELLVLDEFEGDERTDHERMRDRSARNFSVQARLSKHPEANEGLTSEIDPDQGGSYFLAHPEAVITKLYSPLGPFEIFHNKNRELSVVKFTCKATSTKEAREKFIEGVMPFFDYLCFKADLPLFAPLIICDDEKNHLRAFDYVTPFPSATVNPHEVHIIEELLPLYALYREGKNAHSPYYKFLCYFKILEGIYRHIRGATYKKARDAGIDLPTLKEVVPDHPEIDKKLVGQPIGPLFTERFEKSFRDRVAHYILNSGSVLNVSDYATSDVFSKELLLLEICMRVVLQTQETYSATAAKGRV